MAETSSRGSDGASSAARDRACLRAAPTNCGPASDNAGSSAGRNSPRTYPRSRARVKSAVDCWTTAAQITSGRIFRCVSKTGSVWGDSITEKVIWCIARQFASKAQLGKLAPHDLRSTCARLCHVAGGELEQIQFLLGHVSVQTTQYRNRTLREERRVFRAGLSDNSPEGGLVRSRPSARRGRSRRCQKSGRLSSRDAYHDAMTNG